MVSLSELAALYERDGVVLIPQLLSRGNQEVLRKAIDSSIENPSPMYSDLSPDSSGSFFLDFLNFRRNPFIEALVKDVEVLRSLSEVVGTDTIRFFHDNLLVKTGFAPESPWHQDRPHYVVAGPKNFSMWTCIDEVGEQDSLAFVRGSHNFDRLFVPSSFRDGSQLGAEDDVFETLTTAKLNKLSQHGILIFRYQPGDVIVFDNRTIHRGLRGPGEIVRRALSFRYLGDGAFLTHRNIDPTPPMQKLGLRFDEGAAPDDTWFPLLYKREK